MAKALAIASILAWAWIPALAQAGYSCKLKGKTAVHPHWCTDLGILSCAGDPNAPEGSAADIIEALKVVSPSEFLPEDYALHVNCCEQARRKGDAAGLKSCAEQAPLKGELRSVTFIPHETSKWSGIASDRGARFIADCEGRHLHLSADLPLSKQMSLIRKAFDRVALIAATDVLPRFGRVLSDQLIVPSCGVQGDPGSARTVKVHGNFWMVPNSRSSISASSSRFPEAYLARACVRKLQAASKAAVESLSLLQEYERKLREVRALLAQQGDPGELSFLDPKSPARQAYLEFGEVAKRRFGDDSLVIMKRVVESTRHHEACVENRSNTRHVPGRVCEPAGLASEYDVLLGLMMERQINSSPSLKGRFDAMASECPEAFSESAKVSDECESRFIEVTDEIGESMTPLLRQAGVDLDGI